MNELYNSFKSTFPHPSYREGQEYILEKIAEAFESDKKFVILEAPTGSGKSAIGMAIAQHYSTFYLTIQKTLQTQIMNDFGSQKTVDLRGRNAYPCTYWERYANKLANQGEEKSADKVRKKHKKKINCANGPCKTDAEKSYCNACIWNMEEYKQTGNTHCAYYAQVWKAEQANTAVMNFHSFLNQTVHTDRFPGRELMIVDEVHQLESTLMDFVTFDVTDRAFVGVKFPKLDTSLEYLEYFLKIDLLEKIKNQVNLAQLAGNVKALDEWNEIWYKYNNFVLSVKEGTWVCKFENRDSHNKVEFKPVYVNDFATDYVFSKADKVIMMSATILDPNVICKSLGIDKSDVKTIKVKNRFPLNNRKIFYTPAGEMTYRHREKTYPKLIKSINLIAESHKNHKGIIHTYNNTIARMLLEKCDHSVKKRMLHQDQWPTKEKMLEYHAKQDNTIIVAPAMHEGIDLKDDLSRFQILCKVPYPPVIDNEQLKIRIDIDYDYYLWLVAINMVQATGRSIRSETDWARTYILDGSFKKFFHQTKNNILPKWWVDAVVMT